MLQCHQSCVREEEKQRSNMNLDRQKYCVLKCFRAEMAFLSAELKRYISYKWVWERKKAG